MRLNTLTLIAVASFGLFSSAFGSSPPLTTYDAGPFEIDAGFTPDRTEFMAGEPLYITEHVRNIGTLPFATTQIGGLQAYNFGIKIVDPSGKNVIKLPTVWCIDQLSGSITLKPGDEMKEYALATEYAKITKPETYTVICDRTIDVAPPKNQSTLRQSMLDLPLNRKGDNNPAIHIVSTFTVTVDPFDSAKMEQIIDNDGAQALVPANVGNTGLRDLLEIDDPRVIAWLSRVEQKNPAMRSDAILYALQKFSTVESALAMLPSLGVAEEMPHGMPFLYFDRLKADSGVDRKAIVEAVRTSLLKQLHSPVPNDRIHAALAIADTGDSQSLPSLLTATHDPEEPVRCAAAEAIGDLGNQHGKPILVRGLKSSDPEYRDACTAGLKNLQWFTTLKDAATRTSALAR